MAAGSVRPLYAKKLPTPTFVHEKDGLGEIWVPESIGTALDLSAAEFIVETVMGNPGEISLIVLGPMTNIALALALEPRLATSVKRVVAMGGVLTVPGKCLASKHRLIFWIPCGGYCFTLIQDITLCTRHTTRQVRLAMPGLPGFKHRKFVFRAILFIELVSFIGSSTGLRAFWRAFIIMIRPL